MAKGDIAKLPKLGEISLPVHLMVYDDKENPDKHFHSGFAYWWAADGTSDVSDNEGNVIGMIGGKMGGHVEMSRYYPHNGQPHESGKYKQWASVIIDVRDIWDQIEALMDSPDVHVILDGIEEINAKYQAIKAAEKEKKDSIDKRLAEIEKMQKEEDEEREKKEKLSELVSALQNKPELSGDLVSVYTIKHTEIYEDNNWDLTESLKGRDIEFYEAKEKEGVIPNRDSEGKIPLNIGRGVHMYDKGYKKELYTDKKNPGGHDAEVTLKVSSWIGISPGAIHYYGRLHFRSADVHPMGEPTCSTSCYDIPLFEYGDIQLTRVLERWEFSEYKKTYEDWYVGDRYSGFYTPEDVIKRGKEVFADLFGPGWKLVIEEKY
jgi:hypothetical protein